MIKKILIVILLLFFSVITYSFSNVVFIYSELEAFAEDLLEEERYTDLSRLMYGTLMDEEYTYEKTYEDGTILRVYKELLIDYEYDEDNVYTGRNMHEGIRLLFCNVGDDFDVANISDIEVSSSTYLVEEYDGAYSFDTVFYDTYNVFSISLETTNYSSYYDEIVISGESNDVDFSYTIDLSQISYDDICFSTTESNIWAEYITRYNAYYEDGVTDEEELAEIEELMVESAEESSLSISLVANELFSRTGYVVKTWVTIIAIILVNVLVVYLQFIRGKNVIASIRGMISGNKGNNNNDAKDVIDAE